MEDRKSILTQGTGGKSKRVMSGAEAKAKLLSTAKKALKQVEESKAPKYEVKIQLKRMEIATNCKSQYKVQIRCPEVFKVVSKKKYQLQSPYEGDESKVFEGEVVFHDDDVLSKVTMMSLNKDTGVFRSKVMMVEVL